MSVAFTPSVCHINLSAIERNFRKLGDPGRLMPVIKSDAYGHGLVEVAQTLSRAGAQSFAVGLPGEGAILRQLGHRQEILPLLGCIDNGDWEMSINFDLTACVGSFADLDCARELLARYPGKALSVAIKVDTGMSRLGFDPEEIGAVIDFLKGNPGIRPSLLLSHFACADMPGEKDFTDAQRNLFQQIYATFKDGFPEMRPSLGNSAAAITGLGSEIARPGLALYGYNPMPGKDELNLELAMSVSAPVIATRQIKPGQSVSYGRTFIADKPMRIGVIACGYATGFARQLSSQAEVVINGKRVRQIGRVCMSMACLDITDRDDVKTGDAAWILGGGGNQVTALELANLLDTIPYEVLCLMGGLTPRVYSR